MIHYLIMKVVTTITHINQPENDYLDHWGTLSVDKYLKEKSN